AEEAIKTSVDRILTTHVGSLPRPAALSDLLIRQERGEAIDERELDRQAAASVARVVQKQVEVGVDVGNDGEQPRVGFQTYVERRMRGFGGESKRPLSLDLAEFPDYLARLAERRKQAAKIMNAPQAVAEVAYTDLVEAERECDFFARALGARPTGFVEPFMTAASPGIIATTLLNAWYDSYERYVRALAREMKKEYDLIHARGFVLQIDCPDLPIDRPP